jgi:hypothetical protein
MQDADDVLRRPPPQRDPRHRLFEHPLDDLLGRLADVGGDHFGAVDHDVGHGEVAQVEQSAEHVAIELFDAAFPVQQVDRAAQALVRGQQRHALAGPDVDQRQHLAHQPFRCGQDRAEHGDDARDRPRHRQRVTVGRDDGGGLGQQFAEHDHQDRHRDARIDHADIAEPEQQPGERDDTTVATLLPISRAPISRLGFPGGG